MSGADRQRLRLGLRDLAAAAAFGSIAVSGAIPWWAIAVFATALALGLFGRRVLAGRAGWVIGALGLSALLLFASALRGGMDLVIAACVFAGFVTAVRMLSAPGPAADNQVHLTSLLMLAGGAALSGEVLFGGFLLAFAVLASASLGLGVLEGAAAPDEELPVRPALRQLVVGAVVAMVGAAAFFVAFPRLSWNIAARRFSPGLGGAATGFSDRVRLGGGGSIKTNPRVVARLKLQPDPGRERLEAYFIGRTFAAFSGREWHGGGTPRPARPAVALGRVAGRLVHQRWELLPAYEARTLLALAEPVWVGNAVAHTQAGEARTGLVEVSGEEVHFADAALGYSYQATSRVSEPPPGAEPFDRARYLGLPEHLDPRVGELARRLAGDAPDALSAARRLEAHLREEYAYTLELPGDVEDPLADFLFHRKEGHCEHFATALAILLRTLGHPARVAAGFYGGERVADHYVLRAGDAHAWTQVYVPGRGFVSFDATPPSYRAGQPLPALEWLTLLYERVDAFWRTRVLDYSFQDQRELARALVRPPRSASSSEEPRGDRVVWLIAAGAGLLAYGTWRWRTLRPERPRRHRATSFLDDIERALREAKVPRQEGEALEELSARLDAARHPIGPALRSATRRYLEARFGGRPLGPGERARLLESLRASAQGVRAA